MNRPASVHRCETVRDVARDEDGVRDAEALPRDEQALERATTKQFHHEERLVVLSDSRVEHVDDARVTHATERAGLAKNAFARLFVRRHFGEKHLDRDHAPSVRMLRFVNSANAAAPDFASQKVAAVDDGSDVTHVTSVSAPAALGSAERTPAKNL